MLASVTLLRVTAAMCHSINDRGAINVNNITRVTQCGVTLVRVLQHAVMYHSINDRGATRLVDQRGADNRRGAQLPSLPAVSPRVCN